MTSSSFLALLLGAYILCVSVPMIWSRDRLVVMMEQFIENGPLIFITGVLALMGGLSVVYFHNIWTPDWRGLITFFGWIAAIEGALLIAVPGPLMALAKAILKQAALMRILGIVYFLLGVYLLSRLSF